VSIKHWPKDERPREKALKRGVTSLSDAELLAIFYRAGVAGSSAVDIAREHLTQFGSLRAILLADRVELCSARGMGEATYIFLKAALELSRRHYTSNLAKMNTLESPLAVRQFLNAQLRDFDHEVFAGIFLDTQHRMLAFEQLSRGTLDVAPVYPREVVKKALSLGAAAVIFAHNHPSGVAIPSDADRRITQRLCDALALVDIRVLDHFVIGDDEITSFAEQGWL